MDSASPSDQNPLEEREEPKVPCVKVTRPDSHAGLWCLYRLDQFDVGDGFDGADPGETIALEYCLMTAEEIEALPEFEGW